MKKIAFIISLLASSSLSANVTVNCIMVHDEFKEEIFKKTVLLKPSDQLITLYDFQHVKVDIKPHAVVNMNGKDNIYSFAVVLKSESGIKASGIAEEVFNGDSSIMLSLSNDEWSLLTECYQVE